MSPRGGLILLIGAALLAAAGSSSAQAVAAAPSLVTSPPSLVVSAQAGASAEAVVELRDRDGRPVTGAAFLAETSVGSISAVTEAAPGRYVARLEVPPDDMPRAALVVLSPQGRDDLVPAWRVVPISVRTTLTARTEPRSTVSARVGARSFGPVEAARDGSFSLDVELHPGAREAIVTLRDIAGNETRSALPVPRRRHDPITVTLDRYKVTSDGAGKARVFAFAFDETGKAVEARSLLGTVSAGELSPFEEIQPGLWTASYQAPRDGRQGMADVEVRLQPAAGASETEIDRLSIMRGLPGSLGLSADPMRIVAGSTSQVALVARVADAAGNPLPGQPVRFFADRGELAEVVDRGDGSYATSLSPPLLVESGGIEVKALLPVGGPAKQPARIAVTADPKTVPTSWRAFSLVTAVVTDADGQPVPGEIVLFHVSRGQGTVTPAAITYDGGQAFADFAADPTEEKVTVEAVSTTNPALRSAVSIEKRASGQFSIITRPAMVAQGGQGNVTLVISEDKRVLQDAVLLEMVSGEPQRLVASAEPSRLPADGSSQSRIVARLLDAQGNAVREQSLGWSVDRGGIGSDSEDDDGTHETTFTAPEGRGSGRAVVTVSHAASGLGATVPIDLELGPPARLALASDRSELPADGTSRALLTATVEDASGAPIPGAAVRFEVTGGEANVEPDATTDSSGRATSGLVASLVPGEVEITARVDGSGLSASARLELIAMRPERLIVQARPARIRADGQERSEILALVEDGLGQRLEDEPLVARILGPAAGAQLTSERLRSNADGEALTWLSGIENALVRVEVRSERAPSLAEIVEIELVGDTLAAAIVAGIPACAGSVELTAQAPQATRFEWDWTGDGAADAAGPSVIAPLAAGAHDVVLRVRDAAGATGTARLRIDVLPAPVAVIEPAPQHVASGAAVTLDGSASTGGTGPLEWSWDVDADGSSDGDQPTIEWRGMDGLRTAVLTVTDASGCSSSARVSVLFGEPPDLGTTIAATTGPRITPGQEAAFEIGWSNAGPGAGRGVELQLTLQGPASIVRSRLPASARLVSDTEAIFPLGTIGEGASGTFPVHVVAGQDLVGTRGEIVATSRISSPLGDPAPGNDVATASVLIERDVDLRVSLESLSAATLPAGTALDFDLVVANVSGSSAPDVSAQLSWDDALYEVTSLGDGTLVRAGQAAFPTFSLAAGAVQRLRVTGRVRPVLPSTLQDLAISAEAFFSGGDRSPADNRARLRRAVTAAPDLSVELTASPEHVPTHPGDWVTYTADWTNRGTTAAEAVELRSRMTSGTLDRLTDNPFGGVLSGQDLVFQLGRVPAGSAGSVRWTALLSASIAAGVSEACNDASIDEPAGADPNPSNDASAACLPLDLSPALSVAIAAPPALAAGNAFRPTITVSNDGGRADGVEIELRLSGARVASGTASGDPVVLRHVVGSVERGSPQAWRPQVSVPCPQASRDPALQLVATVLVGGAPTATQAAAAVAIGAVADLTSSLSMPASGAAGDALQGTVTIGNVGCAPCDQSEASVTWDALLAGGAQPMTVAGGPLAAGAQVTLPVTIDVLPILPRSSSVLSIQSASTCTGDPDASNDADLAQVALTAVPDASVVSIVAPPSLPAGDSADVIVRVTNGGTTAARSASVSLSERATRHLTISPAAHALGDLPAGDARDLTFRVTAASVLPSAAETSVIEAAVTSASDGDAANDRASHAMGLTAAPDLAASLLLWSATDPPEPGATIEARVSIENVGTTLAAGGSLRMERDAAVLLGLDASQSAGIFDVVLPPIPAGGRWSSTFSFALVAPLPAGLRSTDVTARAAAPGDANPSNDVAARTLQVSDVVDVGVDLTLTASAPVRAGDAVRVTVKCDNDGALDATGVRAVLTWAPAGAVLSVAPQQAMTDLSSAPGRMEWLVDGLPAGDPGKTFTFIMTLQDALPATTNPLDVAAELVLDPVANPENDLADNRDQAGLVALAEADLCVTLAATTNPSRPVPGGMLTYAATVENRGTTIAASPVLVLELDPLLGAPISADAGSSAAPGSLAWTLAPLAPGGSATRSATFTIPALPAPDRVHDFDARASVAAAEDAPTGCAPESTVERVTLSMDADLDVAKTLASSTETPPRRGSRLSYDITVTNAGNDTTSTGSLVDRFPPETRVISTAPAGTVTGREIRWSLGAILPGQTVVHRVVLEVDGGLAPGRYLLHNEAQSASPEDGNAANDVAVHDLEMSLDVDLVTSMTCVPAPSPAAPGSPIECNGTVTNQGSYPADNPRLRLDAGPLAILEASGSSTATLPILPGGAARPLQPLESAAFSFRLRSLPVLPQQSNVVSIGALAESDQPDANPADDAARSDVGVQAWVDLRAGLVALDVDGAPLEAGDLVELTLSLTNADGSMPAAPVQVTGSYDAAVADLVPGGDLAGGAGVLTGSLAAPLLPADPPALLRWSLRIKDVLPAAENPFTPCAGGSASGERSPADDAACTSRLNALAWPDLVVTSFSATAPSTPAAPGEAITFQATVENRGTTAATGVRLQAPRDPGLTSGLLSASVPATDDGTTTSLSLPDLSVGTSASATWQVGIAAAMPAPDTTISATACASASQPQRMPSGHCATDSVGVRAAIDAWVGLAPDLLSGTCVPGSQVRLDVSAGNHGSAPAPSASVIVQVPPQLLVVSAAGWTAGAGTLTHAAGGIAPGSTLSLPPILLQVASELPDASNAVSVTAAISHAAPLAEADPSDDAASQVITCLAWADLVATLERTSAAPAPAQGVAYRVRWRNDGSTTARDVRLAIMDDATLVQPGAPDPGTLARTYDLGSLAPRASGFLDLTYTVLQVLPSSSNALRQRVVLSSSTPEQDPADDAAERTDVVLAQADLHAAIAMAAPGPPAAPGDTITATISWGNQGETASAGRLTITHDPNVQVTATSRAPGSVSGRSLIYDLAPIAVGASDALTVTMRVNAVMPAPAVNVLATCLIEAAEPDQDASNDAGQASVLVAAAPDLRVAVRVTSPSPATVDASGVLEGVMEIENVGTTRATAVGATVRGRQAGLVASAACVDGPCSSAGGVLTWNLGTVAVNPGAAIARRFRITAAATLPALVNALEIEARAYGNESEPDAANNVAVANATITGRPDLRLTSIVPSATVVRPGELVQVGYTYDNVGTAPADPAELAVTYASTQLFPLAATGATFGNGELTFDAGAPVLPGTSATEQAIFFVLPLAPPPAVREVAQTATAQERAPLLRTRDANPADNAADLKLKGCYVTVWPHVTSSRPTHCMGSGITIVADSQPAAGLTYSWSEAGGLGTFSATTGRSTTFFPPVTPGAVTYTVRVVARDAVDPSCFAQGEVAITTDASCASCGCAQARFNVQYDSVFSRWDRAGDKSATQGETLSWRVQLRQTQNVRAGWLVGGPGNTRFSFTDGTVTHVAYLTNDVWMECGQSYSVEFGSAQVPPTMQPGSWPIRFEFVTRDECGNPVSRDVDNNTGDRAQVLAAPAGNSGITFTDWGPSTTGAPDGGR